MLHVHPQPQRFFQGKRVVAASLLKDEDWIATFVRTMQQCRMDQGCFASSDNDSGIVVLVVVVFRSENEGDVIRCEVRSIESGILSKRDGDDINAVGGFGMGEAAEEKDIILVAIRDMSPTMLRFELHRVDFCFYLEAYN